MPMQTDGGGSSPRGSQSGGDAMEVEPEDPGMPRESDGMDVEALVDHVIEESWEEEENNFFRKLTQGVRKTGKVLWSKLTCLGWTVWQSFQQDERCENSGTILNPKQLDEAIRKEYDQLEKLGVGEFLEESEAVKISKQTGMKILSSRWVHVQKTPELVRSRLVVCDYRSCGLSSLRENLYAPTAGIVALRMCLALAQWFNWDVFTLDVSTAFLYAVLLEEERQIITLPPSAQDARGRKLFMRLRKALYGLRRAPLAWFRTLSSFLKEIGGEPTSITTVFRYHYEGKNALALVYVDDVCTVGDRSLASWVIQKLQDRFQIKPTGHIPAGRAGGLQYLGREVVRFHDGGVLTLGLPSSYYEQVEQALEMSLKAVQNPPRLERYVDQEEQLLSEKEAKIYRTALGKLAWVAVTLPVIQFQVHFVSCYQSKPTVAGMCALKDAIRYMKRFIGYRQTFGTAQWGENLHEVEAVVDASWSLRSVAGGVIFGAKSLLATYSRRIQTTCLSSAEAELHTITEGTQEMMSAALMMEAFLKGMPDRLPDGNFSRVTGTLQLRLHTDSESARCISKMAGLLRKMRHLELRLCYIQELTEAGRLIVEFIRGDSNFSDILTKSSDRSHVEQFLEETGLNLFEGEAALREVLEKMEPGEKAVRFGENEVFEFDEANVFRSIPERWKNLLDRNPELSHWKPELAKWVRGTVPLVIEVCCQKDSAISKVVRKSGTPYLGITEEVGFSNAVKAILRFVIHFKRHPVCIHLSTPCTAGCGLRNLQLERSEKHMEAWKQRIAEHKEIWNHIDGIFQKEPAPGNIGITQEWPRGNDLWKDGLYLRVSGYLKLQHSAVVRRCCLDGVRKVWEVRTNKERLASLLATGECRCEEIEQPESLKASGYYSEAVAKHFVGGMRTWTREHLRERR